MDQLQILNAKLSLHTAIQSMKISLEEIKEKRPNSVYISGLEKHISQLSETLITFSSMEKQNSMLSRMNYNHHKQNLELKYENEQLKIKVDNLLKGI